MKNTGASDLSRRVSAELRAARARLGFTWTDIEQATGIPHSTMHRMINGDSDIPVSKLLLICAAAGIEAVDILEEATRHMPDNYLQDLLVSPTVSPAPSNVVPMKPTNWNGYQGKKAADVDHEDVTDPKT